MNTRVLLRFASVVLVAVIAAAPAVGYIHFPPMTMQKMCQQSRNIRVLGVKKHDHEKGVVVYEVVETLKGEAPRSMALKHSIRKDADGVQPIFDWVEDGKQAVMFTIEGGAIACGYVFIDEFCYSVDHNRAGDYWLLVRADPQMSACFHGSVEQLQEVTKDVLAGKEVTVPVKEPGSPISKEDRERRAKEVNEVLTKNRGK